MELPVRIRQTRCGDYLAESTAPGGAGIGPLPGCVGRGRNAAEARRRFADAARGYIAAVGNFVPERLDVR